jgi:hypothetical protein
LSRRRSPNLPCDSYRDPNGPRTSILRGPPGPASPKRSSGPPSLRKTRPEP